MMAVLYWDPDLVATNNVVGTTSSGSAATAGGPVSVGSYTNQSASAYGLADMLGNVAEITDSSNATGQFRAMGGGYPGAADSWSATASPVFQSGAYSSVAYGFRIAARASAARPVTRFSYDAVGNQKSVTDPLGNVTAYAYDTRDRRTTVTDARGFATVTTFDAAGNTTSVTDASGNVTRYAFDRLNRRVTETDTANSAATTAWQFSYDALGQVVKSRMAPGEIVQTPALDFVPNPPGALAASGQETASFVPAAGMPAKTAPSADTHGAQLLFYYELAPWMPRLKNRP